MRLRRSRCFAISSLVTLALGIPVLGAAESVPTAGQLPDAVTIETSDKPLETVLQWISRRAQVNIVCYEQDQPRITLRLANVTWQEAVESIATKYDLVIERKSPRVWVLSRPPKVSMSFQDASLPVVLEAIARAADVNIIMSGEVSGGGKRLSMTLKGVPWRQALDVVVKTVDLAWVESEYSIIRIVSPGSLAKDLQTRILRVNYGTADDMAAALKPVLTEGTVLVDKISNTLILSGTPNGLDAAVRIAEQLDQRTREVLIEMRFVDYSVTDVQTLGVDPISLNFDIEHLGNFTQRFSPFGNVGMTTMSRIGSGPATSNLNSVTAAFEAVASLNSTDIIQSPQILTLDNTEAEVTLGGELHFAEESVSTENGQTIRSLKEAATSPVKDGILIKLKTHITADGYVRIELEAENSDVKLQAFTSGSGETASTIQLPQKTTTILKHTIMAADGHTAVIGGLLRDKDIEQRGHVPGLGTIPVLGWFFRKQSKSVEKRNLTIFITPRIIPFGQKNDYEKGLEALKTRLSGVQEAAPAAGAGKAGQAPGETLSD